MGIPQALRIARIQRGRRQGEIAGYSQQQISAIEHKQRSMAADAAAVVSRELDHPALYFEMARELTGGWGAPWLNGPNVDLHRSSTKEKALEEVDEAKAVMLQFASSKPPQMETERERLAREAHLLQVQDAVVALLHYIGTQCEEYGFSMMKVSRDHYNKLRCKGFVKA